MAMCPECRAAYGDDVETCPEHGCALVPDDILLPAEVVLPEGSMVGEYRIQKKLGAGTFGDVYAGEHPLIGKRVAVKVLNRRFASDPVMVSRFVAEARAVNKIRQRNIIDIFSFGVLPGEARHYFVMELLDGKTLGALMAEAGRLPVAVVLPIIRGIADALDAVHEAGITHRDLKPDNVFLAKERDGSYYPKLLDFGIAKLIGDDVAHKTGSGMVLGTPRYMSPEQARGKTADHRADIYALGVMIHEMLTGAAPFAGDSSVDLLLKHVVDPPPRMSAACPSLPPELDAPVLAMLEKRPADRPSSAGRAVAALVAAASNLGLDRAAPSAPSSAPATTDQEGVSTWSSPTLLASSQQPQPPDEGAEPRGEAASTRRAVPKYQGETLPTAGKGKGQDAPAAAGRAPRAPPEATLVSAPDSSASSGQSAPSTENLSAVETDSAVRRLEKARRWKVGAFALVALAGGLTVWMLGRAPDRARDGGVTAASTPIAPPPPTAPPPATEIEPTVRPSVPAPEIIELRLATRPPDVEVWMGDRKIGDSSGPLTLPRGSARVELRLKKSGFRDETLGLTPDHNQSLDATLSPLSSRTVKPAGSAGRMDRILGDRD
jgi:serine/threonine-protein kinase